MKVVGIIAEYNPFHNGHAWHLQQAKQITGAEYTVAAISGHFSQRGEPTILNKWQRAELAVKAGVDLIIELPTVYAVRSAQYFAIGGVRLLNSLGIITHIAFGAENPDLAILMAIAKATDNYQVRQQLKTFMQSGITYAKALEQAIAQFTNIDPTIIFSPNNILAFEYLRAIDNYAQHIIPIPVARYMSNTRDTLIKAEICSSTAIRNTLNFKAQNLNSIAMTIPAEIFPTLAEFLSHTPGVYLQNFSNIILHILRTQPKSHLVNLPDINEGLHNKLKKASLLAYDLESLLINIKSKRYTRTRIQRILIHALLAITRQQVSKFDNCGPQYIRILAFNNRGQKLLQKINSQAAVPIITKTTKYLNSIERENKDMTLLQEMLTIDTRATDVYTLGYASATGIGGLDFRNSPIIIND